MAKQDTSTKTYVGTRSSNKQFKRFLAAAKRPEERAAIKSLFLGEPARFYAKEADEPAAEA